MTNILKVSKLPWLQMNHRRNTVIGLDPGTTTGYAVLDLRGRLLRVASSRNLSLGDLIKQIIAFGDVLIVGTDKARCPGMVSLLASRLGARIVTPAHDLSIAEKKEIATMPCSNEHEEDALASALFAFHEFRPLLTRIDRVLRKAGEEEYAERVKRSVVLRQSVNITDAIKAVEIGGSVDREDTPRKKKRPMKTERASVKKGEMQRGQRDKTRLAVKLLKQQNAKLKKRIRALRGHKNRLLRALSAQLTDEKARQLIEFKDARIRNLYSRVEEQEADVSRLRAENSRLRGLILSLNSRVIVKKLPNLGLESLTRSKELNIKEGYLYVRDCSITHPKVLGMLSGVKAIIYEGGRPGIEGIPLIEASSVKLREFEDFMVADSEELEKATRRDMLKRIVAMHRSERITTPKH